MRTRAPASFPHIYSTGTRTTSSSLVPRCSRTTPATTRPARSLRLRCALAMTWPRTSSAHAFFDPKLDEYSHDGKTSRTLRNWAAVGLIALPLAPAQAQDVNTGKQVFSQCAARHSIDGSNGAGPSLKGIVGTKAGAFPGFRFSRGMKNSPIVWDAKSLNALSRIHKRRFPATSCPTQAWRMPSNAPTSWPICSRSSRHCANFARPQSSAAPRSELAGYNQHQMEGPLSDAGLLRLAPRRWVPSPIPGVQVRRQQARSTSSSPRTHYFIDHGTVVRAGDMSTTAIKLGRSRDHRNKAACFSSAKSALSTLRSAVTAVPMPTQSASTESAATPAAIRRSV